MNPWKEGKMSFIINPLEDGDENMKPNHIIFDLATSTIDSTEKMSEKRSLCSGAPIVHAMNNFILYRRCSDSHYFEDCLYDTKTNKVT